MAATWHFSAALMRHLMSLSIWGGWWSFQIWTSHKFMRMKITNFLIFATLTNKLIFEGIDGRSSKIWWNSRPWPNYAQLSLQKIPSIYTSSTTRSTTLLLITVRIYTISLVDQIWLTVLIRIICRSRSLVRATNPCLFVFSVVKMMTVLFLISSRLLLLPNYGPINVILITRST